MKWSIQQLQRYRGEELQLNDSVDVEKVKELDREIREVTPVHVTGHAEVTRDRAVFILHLEGEMTLPCARTLNDVSYPFSIDTVEIFQLSERATFDEDDDVHELESNTVDLLPWLREQVLLAKPLRVFSDLPEGPAPKSGNGWELETEEPEGGTQKVDPRLAKLGQWLDKNE
ncbi:YceD family protein [Alkalicoccus urumqiensis]|uniref:DUF177 domain-containing protein n=1 Tax=Alkalicoccus urumqiensis TaxID=1548213 RepID=A0A2P6MEQ6_ALKUR|nr:YceD family protein [Alkalicoccus urumqiensis]PRO64741.1 hypothetical protein C6I21_12580 [Alkalicoccus urumqiensis]